MTYTIISASYANREHTAACVITVEQAAVMASAIDTPALWADLMAWAAGDGRAIAAFVLPEEA